LIDLFDRLGRCGVRLFLARRDLVVRLLLGRVQRLFGVLGADRQVGELIGESFGHVFAPSGETAHVMKRKVTPANLANANKTDCSALLKMGRLCGDRRLRLFFEKTILSFTIVT